MDNYIRSFGSSLKILEIVRNEKLDTNSKISINLIAPTSVLKLNERFSMLELYICWNFFFLNCMIIWLRNCSLSSSLIQIVVPRDLFNQNNSISFSNWKRLQGFLEETYSNGSTYEDYSIVQQLRIFWT